MIAKLRAQFCQFLLYGIEALPFFPVQANAGQLSILDEFLDDALLGGIEGLPCATRLQSLQALVKGRALAETQRKLHDLGLYGVMGLPQCLIILDSHEMPNDAPDHTEAVTEPFDGLNQAFPGGLHLRFQLLKLGVQGGEQVLHRWHDVLRRDQIKTGQGR